MEFEWQNAHGPRDPTSPFTQLPSWRGACMYRSLSRVVVSSPSSSTVPTSTLPLFFLPQRSDRIDTMTDKTDKMDDADKSPCRPVL